MAPYVAVRVVGWLRPLSLLVTGPGGGSTMLPRFEVLLTAGVAFGRD
jgi:hypothetical protein